MASMVAAAAAATKPHGAPQLANPSAAASTMPTGALSTDEVLRAQVLTLFGRCDHDVGALFERVVQALRETGRTDLSLNSDANAAIITVAQGIKHAPSRYRGDFLDQLNQQFPAPPVHTANGAHIEAAARDAARFRPHAGGASRGEQGGDGGGSEDAAQHRHHRRCFPYTDRDEKRESFPTSNYNGNFLLRRYGGCFPPHARYEFYRQYGMSGQGAASSEHHNLPMGEAPHR